MKSLLIAFTAGMAGLSCQATSAESSSGRLEATWIGADTGKIKVRAHATWCAPGRLLELTGVDSDAGMGLAVYPADSLASGPYAAFNPAKDTLHRPAVAVGVRWFTETEIKGYQSDSGALSLTRRDGTLEGSIDARMHATTSPETIRVTGTFHGVPVTLDSTRCAADSIKAESVKADSVQKDSAP
jgi:hypothetical protein